MLAIALALCTWLGRWPSVALALLNVNVSALQLTLELKGKTGMLAIARELAWRKARFNWNFEVAHLPTQQNKLADALSRIHDPTPP